MPRLARERSTTGIYHIMLRGIDKRDIFLDDEDKIKFLDSLSKAKEKGNFELYGYCLMDNHVHLLMKESEEIGTSIKRITVGYVGWHNKKYERTGHLFQNRFLSESVASDKYLLTVLRYIHQNPIKAYMVNKVEDYSYSSFREYYRCYEDKESIIDPELTKDYFKTFEAFHKFMVECNDDECLEYKNNSSYNDATLIELLNNHYNLKGLMGLANVERIKVIKEIYNNENISIRTLSRITGISKTTIENAVKKDKGNVPVSGKD